MFLLEDDFSKSMFTALFELQQPPLSMIVRVKDLITLFPQKARTPGTPGTPEFLTSG